MYGRMRGGVVGRGAGEKISGELVDGEGDTWMVRTGRSWYLWEVVWWVRRERGIHPRRRVQCHGLAYRGHECCENLLKFKVHLNTQKTRDRSKVAKMGFKTCNTKNC